MFYLFTIIHLKCIHERKRAHTFITTYYIMHIYIYTGTYTFGRCNKLNIVQRVLYESYPGK